MFTNGPVADTGELAEGSFESGEAFETERASLQSQEIINPPDDESMRLKLEESYKLAKKYSESHMGQSRNSAFELNGKTFAKRQQLIELGIKELDEPETEMKDPEADPSETKLIPRDEMIIKVSELIIEQAAADMLDAQEQLNRAAGLMMKVDALSHSTSLPDLKLAQEMLKGFDQSSIDLTMYLKSLPECVKGLELFAKNTGHQARYDAFMDALLVESHLLLPAQAEQYDPDQKRDQRRTTFVRQIRSLTDRLVFVKIQDTLEKRIQTETKNETHTTAEPQAEADTTDSPDELESLAHQMKGDEPTAETAPPASTSEQPKSNKVFDFLKYFRRDDKQKAA